MQRMAFEVPTSIKAEHQELHASIERATRYPGKVGESARQLAAVLHPHFMREEQLALRPLGLLQQLSQGKYTPEMAHALPMIDSLRAELPEMLREHETIAQAARRLRDVARLARAADVARFAEALLAHARMEEEVLYPAALLVGDLIRRSEVVPA